MEVILKKSYKAKVEDSSGTKWLSKSDTVEVDKKEYDRLFALDYCERAVEPRAPIAENVEQPASTRKTTTRRK